ncbi:hypothetical protein RFI_25101 [Reticulomyxa filosa]|uniref:Uncharacterized protein n=1 Tax=Reticulomyxa filosa TaxID=46433 RepID=X6MF41_RETFI|nr:hypothetical protein RFI_25101 [Reticulomyxa filosa]|eukprot:ETO12276.1 hypothetical protein RFI_25101 [Reticulomyxa filosa]
MSHFSFFRSRDEVKPKAESSQSNPDLHRTSETRQEEKEGRGSGEDEQSSRKQKQENGKWHELNQLMDPSTLTRKEKICIMQMMACIAANHIHRHQLALQEDTPTSKNYPKAIGAYQQPSVNTAFLPSSSSPSFSSKRQQSNKKQIPKSVKRYDYSNDGDEATPNTVSFSASSNFDHNNNSNNDNNNNNNNNNNHSNSNGSKTFQIKMYYPVKKKGHNCSRETSMDYMWSERFLKSFWKYLKINSGGVEHNDSSLLDGLLLYLSHPSYIDPTPFMETLEWKTRLQWIRIPLLLVGFSISSYGYYHSRVRGFLKYLMGYVPVEWTCEFIIYEYTYSMLLTDILVSKEKSYATHAVETHAAQKQPVVDWTKWGKIAGVGLFGGSLIALSGGLAAPAIAAGVGAIGLTATGTFLLTSVGTTTLTVIFGVTGASYTGYKMKKVLGDLEEFELVPMVTPSIHYHQHCSDDPDDDHDYDAGNTADVSNNRNNNSNNNNNNNNNSVITTISNDHSSVDAHTKTSTSNQALVEKDSTQQKSANTLPKKRYRGLSVVITIPGWMEQTEDSSDSDSDGDNDNDNDGNHNDNDDNQNADAKESKSNASTQAYKSTTKSKSARTCRRKTLKKKIIKKKKKKSNDSTSAEQLLYEYWEDILGSIMKNIVPLFQKKKKKNYINNNGKKFKKGNGIKGFAKQKAITGTLWTSGSVGLGYTALGTLVSALSWPATLLAAADIIDKFCLFITSIITVFLLKTIFATML